MKLTAALFAVRNILLSRAAFKKHCLVDGHEERMLGEIAEYYSTQNQAIRTGIRLLHAAHLEAQKEEQERGSVTTETRP